ncbi:hypothetical protein SALBM311S_12204 [Streptomyces alboniger]
MHSWLGGEQPSETYAALAPHLGYVQVKDIASADDTTPLPLGKGVLPLAECVEVLSRHGWDGWLCWEYEKRWYEAAEPLPDLLGPGGSTWPVCSTTRPDPRPGSPTPTSNTAPRAPPAVSGSAATPPP